MQLCGMPHTCFSPRCEPPTAGVRVRETLALCSKPRLTLLQRCVQPTRSYSHPWRACNACNTWTHQSIICVDNMSQCPTPPGTDACLEAGGQVAQLLWPAREEDCHRFRAVQSCVRASRLCHGRGSQRAVHDEQARALLLWAGSRRSRGPVVRPQRSGRGAEISRCSLISYIHTHSPHIETKSEPQLLQKNC
jgi:hypothetical protein